MTDEELDALVRDAVFAADCLQETGTFETAQGVLHDCATAITTLRAQLAEARAERDAMIHPDHVEGLIKLAEPMLYEALAAETARADRAKQRVATPEAALAAQIEVDAGLCGQNEMAIPMDHTKRTLGGLYCADVWCGEGKHAGHGYADLIRNQPHDRTALDRHDTKTREKALREAAQACDWGDIYGDNAVRTILALIDKEKTE